MQKGTYCPAISSRTSVSSWSWTLCDRWLNCTDPYGRLRYRLSWIRRWFRNKELAVPQDCPFPPTPPSNCPQDRKDTSLCPFPRRGRIRGEANGLDCSATDIHIGYTKVNDNVHLCCCRVSCCLNFKAFSRILKSEVKR